MLNVSAGNFASEKYNAMKKAFLFITILHSIAAYAQTVVPDTISAQQLDEVVVHGEKPQVKGEDGIMVVDLPGIVKDKPVNNILEALGYMPGVANNNGMIWLTGASNVTIILNGELTNMPLQNLYQLLYNTPVDRLKNVEIMYSAPAKYHVNGAVINVILKTPTPLDGLQGQVRAGYNQAHYDSYGGVMAATYAIKDWAFDLNYGLTRSKSWSREETWSNHLYDGERAMIEDDMRRIGQNWSNTIFASAAWKTLKLTYNGQIISDSHSRALSSGTLGNYTNAYKMLSPVGYHNIALRYTAPFGMTVGGDYTRYSENRSQSLFKDADYLLGSENRQAIDRWHVYIDQQHQIGKWKLDYGTEYQHSRDHSSQHYALSGNPDFDDCLNEDVASFYAGTQTGVCRSTSRQRVSIITINISTTGISFLNSEQLTTRHRKAYSSLISAPDVSIPHIGNFMEGQAISTTTQLSWVILNYSHIYSTMHSSIIF